MFLTVPGDWIPAPVLGFEEFHHLLFLTLKMSRSPAAFLWRGAEQPSVLNLLSNFNFSLDISSMEQKQEDGCGSVADI